MSRNAFFTSALYLLCREVEDDESLWSRGAKLFLFKWWEVISPKMYNPHLWQSISITHQNEYVKPKWKRGYCEVLAMVKWFFLTFYLLKNVLVFLCEKFSVFQFCFLTSSSWLHEAFHCLRHPVLACVTDLKTPDSFSSRWRNILPHQSAYH